MVAIKRMRPAQCEQRFTLTQEELQEVVSVSDRNGE
jgi:hypothetical protein